MGKSVLLLILATAISGTINCLVPKTDAAWLIFISPPLLWSLALLLPIHRRLSDKGFAYLLFPTGMLVLWFLMLLISLTFGSALLAANLRFAYPIIGGIAGLASYGLYAKLILSRFAPAEAGFCFAMGYLAFFLNSFVEPKDKIFLENEKTALFLLWQAFVGIGHALAYYKMSRENNTTL